MGNIISFIIFLYHLIREKPDYLIQYLIKKEQKDANSDKYIHYLNDHIFELQARFTFRECLQKRRLGKERL